MPIREYRCRSCDHVQEEIEFPGQDDLPALVCNGCGGKRMSQVPAAPVAHFKGWGWTDKFHHRGLRAEQKRTDEDTLEEDSNGQLRPKAGVGHNKPAELEQ